MAGSKIGPLCRFVVFGLSHPSREPLLCSGQELEGRARVALVRNAAQLCESWACTFSHVPVLTMACRSVWSSLHPPVSNYDPSPRTPGSATMEECALVRIPPRTGYPAVSAVCYDRVSLSPPFLVYVVSASFSSVNDASSAYETHSRVFSSANNSACDEHFRIDQCTA